jgi:hypothetical protein
MSQFRLSPGAGPDFDQVEGRGFSRRQGGKTGAQYRRPRHFIGVGDAALDQAPHLGFVIEDKIAEWAQKRLARPGPTQGGVIGAQVVLRAAQQQEMHSREQKIGGRLARPLRTC